MNELTEILYNSGIENAEQELRWLKKYYKGDIDKALRRRAAGEPLQYILGEWEFYGYPFKVGPGVLIPRPETELLVDLAKEYKPKLVLDLCAGTGCVGIALAKKIHCNVIAVEKYPEAINYLKRNIELNNAANNIEIIQSDVLRRTQASFSERTAIIINPPYLSKADMNGLQKEVTYEPKTALYGGGDGLDFCREFLRTWEYTLKHVMLFACEVGDNQAEKVCELMENIGLTPKIKQDYNKINRIVYSTKEN